MSEESIKLIKCGRCHKTVSVSESYDKTTCPKCLSDLREKYQTEGEELSEECRAFREHSEDSLLFDLHLVNGKGCARCKRWLANKRKVQESNDYWAQETRKSLGSCGGENGAGFVRICPYCGQVLDENGECPSRCCGEYPT